MTSTPVSTPDETVQAVKPDKSEAIQKSYSQAAKQLREKHLKEFNAIRQAILSEQGIDWSPEPTEQEKAAAEIAGLIAKFPELAAQFAQQ